MQSVSSKPGLNSTLLDLLAKKRTQDPSNYEDVCVLIDAMSIRRQTLYNSRMELYGYVNLGDGPDERYVATEALVFMVVGLKTAWKAPIGYFLTNTLKAQPQAVLVTQAIEALHERGIKVTCITMDGHQTNLSMAEMLGCKLCLSDLKTSFDHPITKEPIFILMDPCHMVKLTRNMLDAYRTIISSSGSIEWEYIRKLNNVQEKSGLHLANKLTFKHVNFSNQNMKVSLAAQTLSRSVAVALETMKDLGYKEFEDCSATIEFITVSEVFFMGWVNTFLDH